MRPAFLAVLCVCTSSPAAAADWPMWRYDAARTARSPQALGERLQLLWTRQEPPLVPAYWQTRQERVQFDRGYEPIVLGRTLVYGSSRDDSATALDAATGALRWRTVTDGPVRLAPAGWKDRVFVASDDGCLYCLAVADGRLIWKVRPAPSPRKVMGNGRLISTWPVRGGPVVADGIVYLAAGVWPFEGIFVQALDAMTGKVLWTNDRTGSLYIEHPHGAMSFGGPSPQGYLLLRQGELVVPSSRAFPAFFDRKTGELIRFAFGHGGHGSVPGGWFLATDAAGRLAVDPQINSEIHDAGRQVVGQKGIRRKPDEPLAPSVHVGEFDYELVDGLGQSIWAGSRQFRFSEGYPGVRGTIHTMLAADGRLFVVTQEGTIQAFGPAVERHAETTGKIAAEQKQAAPASAATGIDHARSLLAAARVDAKQPGVAVVWGIDDGSLVEGLVAQTALHVVALDRESQRVDLLRRRLKASGVYGVRAAAHVGDLEHFGLPPYLATLVTSERWPPDGAASDKAWNSVFKVLRPYGGQAALQLASVAQTSLAAATTAGQTPGGSIQRVAAWTVLKRSGPPQGSTDYAGQANFDQQVAAPLGLLWFGDTEHHHKLFYQGYQLEGGRGLPPPIRVTAGILHYRVTREPLGPNPAGVSYTDYLKQLQADELYSDAYIDLYTGTRLPRGPAAVVPSGETVGPPGGAPPVLPVARRNPLTGVVEGREFQKSHGCDRWPADYGHLMTLRSGTAAFYDKRMESGIINVSGTRSGCRNSMVPAGGVLALPSWTGNCTCNYPVYTSLALASLPEDTEQWTAWGDVAVTARVRRLGVNFGAPGDRVTRDGTLWIDWPSVGGPSPDIPIEVEPADAKPFYRHAIRLERGEGWPWVVASGVTGVRRIRIEPIARRPALGTNGFGVRWTGSLRAPHSGTYTLHVKTDSGVRIWLGPQSRADNTRQIRRGQATELKFPVTLETGVAIPIVLEYFRPQDAANDAGFELAWSRDSSPREPIKAEYLLDAEGRPGGLTARYYGNRLLEGPSVLAREASLRFDWRRSLPSVLAAAAAAPRKETGSYTVRLSFAEPDDARPGDRAFSVRLQGSEVLPHWDIVREAKGPRRGVVREFPAVEIGDRLDLEFVAHTSLPPLVCGLELIATP